MQIPKSQLATAFAEYAAPAMVQAFTNALPGHESLTLEEAGRALVTALCPFDRYGDIGGKTLSGIEVRTDGQSAWLDPQTVINHPHLWVWAETIFAQAVMVPVEAAYSMAYLTGPIATFRGVSVTFGEGICSCRVEMFHPDSGATVTAYYGSKPDTFFSTVCHTYSGDALFMLGDRLRLANNEAIQAAHDEAARERAESRLTVH